MREPIKPEDIQAGDHIRVEWVTVGRRLPGALEYVAPHGGTAMRKRMSDAEYGSAKWYLLKRPTPAVQMPDTPTLGWLSSVDGEVALSTWRPDNWVEDQVVATVAIQGSREFRVGMTEFADRVTTFTPAVAVPKAALDELREDLGVERSMLQHLGPNAKAAQRFLAAVDAANGADQ